MGKLYTKEFKELLELVFEKRAFFGDFFGGSLESLDGVQNNAEAFMVKTSDIPVVVGTYNTDANVAFGAGTGNSSRWGDRTEIIYSNTPVNYTWGWSIHEGLDRFTVNNTLEDALADRLDFQAQAKVNLFNKKHGEFISANASTEFEFNDYTDDKILQLFNNLSKYFNNKQAIGTKVAKVNSDLYNAIIDHPSVTILKNSDANIDLNEIVYFKGFSIEQIPENIFKEGDIAYVYIAGVGKAFTGIDVVRTFETESFNGVVIQGGGLAGEYILPANKEAVVKVTSTIPIG